MRKRIIPSGPTPPDASAPPTDAWLPLEDLCEVEITSENPAHPIEGALVAGGTAGGTAGEPGWRAADPGEQTIRLLFPEPRPLSRVRVEFVEADVERTQEYVLRWAPELGTPVRDLVRQQWNFSPGGATEQVEEHVVDLPAVAVLELTITPDISGGPARASLARLRLA